ncbi:MAG TPA: hypothetical protein VGC76_05110 [Pyrinomonadaceae bacterium]|jgi:hypothetical protein
MGKPKSIRRLLISITPYGERVGAMFRFNADFGTVSLKLEATVQVQADKTTSIQSIERMADKEFVDMLQATISKCQEGIISN